MEQQFIPYTATKFPAKGRVLVLAPHPDYEVFGCAGAIMRHVEQGDFVQVVLITNGEAAKPHDSQTASEAYAQLRREESIKASVILAYQQLSFWNVADRGFEYSDYWVQRLCDLIQTQAISRVYACSPWEIHPDHYALAQVAIAAVQRFGEAVALAMYEVAVPLHPNQLLDISDLIARKRMAMNCFKSQLVLQNYRQQIEGLNAYRAYTLPTYVRAAEAYYVQTGKTLRTHSTHYGRSRQSESWLKT